MIGTRSLGVLFLSLLSLAISLPLVAQQPEVGGIATQTSSNYVIRPLDALRIRILNEPDSMVEVRVGADGMVGLPFIGQVKISGLTIERARNLIFELLDADYFVNPQVDVVVLQYRERRVEVLGKVNRQGPIAFPSEEEMYLLEAISRAGGWSVDRLANQKQVRITRKQPDGSVTEITVDATKINAREVPLFEGDLIFVPERLF